MESTDRKPRRRIRWASAPPKVLAIHVARFVRRQRIEQEKLDRARAEDTATEGRTA